MSNTPQAQDDRTSSFGGRVFSRFSLMNDVYCVPIDEEDEQRLDELNRIIRELFNNRIVLPPTEQLDLSNIDEPEVLDCGSGKGAWIDDLLGEYEDCCVTGLDVFFGRGNEDDEEDDDSNSGNGRGVQEFVKHRWNLNARFRYDRSESRLLPDTFDLINSRFLAEGIDETRWESYIRDLRILLKPGGWLQMVELELRFQSHNGSLQYTANEPLFRWQTWYDSTMREKGKDSRIGSKLGRYMRDAGFVNVNARAIHLQIGPWNQQSASLGTDILSNVRKTIAAVSLWPFAGQRRGHAPPHMTIEQWGGMVYAAQQELLKDGLRLYYTVHFAIGQRPVRSRRRR